MAEELNLPLQEGSLESCNCCKKKKYGCEWQDSGKYWLCLACKSKIELRLAESRAKKYSQASFEINRAELIGLRADGLLPVRTYILFALKLDYPNGMPKTGLNIPEFCEVWQVTQGELLSAMGSLSRKGIVVLKTKSLDIETKTRQERIEAIEKSINS